MKICDFSSAELTARLAETGIFLSTGPFVLHLRSPIPQLADAIGYLYADFPIADSGILPDYHVSILRPGGIRLWFRPQAAFDFDGVRPFNPLPLRLAMPLLEWGLNWSVFNHAHQYLMIHAAVLEREGRALLLPAPSGSGKSTLCAALSWSGWRLMTDELALISPASGRLAPLPRPVGLKNDSIDIIRAFAPEAEISPVWRDPTIGAIAYMRPHSETVARAHETAIPGWIVFSSYSPDAPAALEPMLRSRAFLHIADNAINYSILGREGFETLSLVMDRTSCFSLKYGNLKDAVEILDAMATP